MNSNGIYTKWKRWKSNDLFFSNTIFNLDSNKESEIKKYFSSTLAFTDSQVVAKMRAGTNFLNEFTVSGLAHNYAKFMKKNLNFTNKGIFVSFDNKPNSYIYAKAVSTTLFENNIKVFLMDRQTATPDVFSKYIVQKHNLSGSISISYEYANPQFNSLKFTKENAQLLNKEDEKIFNKHLEVTDFLDLNLNTKLTAVWNFFPTSELEDFVNSFVPEQQNPKNTSVSIDFLAGTTMGVYDKVLLRSGYKVNVVSKAHKNLNQTSSNLRSLKKVITLAKRNKSDLAISVNPDGKKFSIAYRQRKLFKYLTSNEISVLFTNYIAKKFSKQKGKAIILSKFSSNHIKKIALTHKIKVYEREEHEQQPSFYENIEEDILLDLSNDYHFKIQQKKDFGFDKTMESILLLAQINDFYLNQGKTLYDALEECYSEFGYYRHKIIPKIIFAEQANKYILRLRNAKKIGEHKIIKKEISTTHTVEGKVLSMIYKLENNIWFGIKYSLEHDSVVTFVETFSKENNKIKAVVAEKILLESLDEYSEIIEQSLYSKKGLLKYTFFLFVIVLIFVVLFNTVFKQNGSTTDVLKNVKNILFDSPVSVLFLYLILCVTGVQIIFATISLKRMLILLNQKTHFRHILISRIIAIVISNVTPLAIGGDTIGYWYMRKKGLTRGPLIASFLMSSLMYQVTLIIFTIIILPIGFTLFPNVLLGDNTRSKIVLYSLLGGSLFDIIGAIVIWSIVGSKRLQNFVVKSTTFGLEYFGFIYAPDPLSFSSNKHHEFQNTRESFKILSASFYKIIEQIFYFSIPWILQTIGFIVLVYFYKDVNQNLSGGVYFNSLIGNSLVRAANSFSPTPGGLGTGDYIYSGVFSALFVNNKEANAKILTLFMRLVNFVIPTVLSACLLLTIILGESRISKYEKIKRIKKIDNDKSEDKVKTTYYRYASVFWFFIFSGLVGTPIIWYLVT